MPTPPGPVSVTTRLSDLRTPLTELRARLEVLILGLRKMGDEDTWIA
ncbi:hypothetical protein ACFQ3P_31765 [Paraburkholderia sabiae]|uniref:Uncharacterized protein n=1 Tax=Paraburkholderia sabiae TaxID=273251 RepID=A0ABU9QCL1_9BURK|nr:hypothetical protein [Paraburkholderia sabiae]WJZ72619.1 hypothetical protein QEN71_20940 [Paraburkholderia sabiae]